MNHILKNIQFQFGFDDELILIYQSWQKKMFNLGANYSQLNFFTFLSPLQQYNYIFESMISSKPKTKRIGKYHFRLIGPSQLFYKGEQIVSFTPQPKKKNNLNNKIIPTFNTDRKHYNSAFHIPSCIPQPDQQMRQEHEKRVIQSMIELSEILVPKPRSRHKYCGVCRNHYEDYKDHIEGEQHLVCLKKSQYQALISQFCEQYQQRICKRDQEESKVLELTEEEIQFRASSGLTYANSNTFLT